MIGQLRRTFIRINMALVTGVMLAAFGVILFFHYQSLKADTFEVLRKTLDNKGGPPPAALSPAGEERKKAAPLLPSFMVETDAAGAVVTVGRHNFTVTDELAAEVSGRVLTEEKESGVLGDFDLRYFRVNAPDGIKIAFADTTRETEGMKSMLLTLLWVALGGLAAFYLVSRYLAGWALRPAEQAWEQQRRFVADASHELKTPLTVILANCGILLAHRQDSIAQQARWIENTQTEAARMKKLVDDLLFLAKTDAAAELVQERFNLSDAVWSAMLPFESLAYEQGITLNHRIEPDIHFIGNAGQLQQLVVILLDNACKYAGPAGIITLKLERKQGEVQLAVHNTGEPIQPEHLPHLFERFYRPDGARARQQGGYGLGLAIAASIVQHHGGRISVKSSAGEGTTFTVCLKQEGQPEE